MQTVTRTRNVIFNLKMMQEESKRCLLLKFISLSFVCKLTSAKTLIKYLSCSDHLNRGVEN